MPLVGNPPSPYSLLVYFLKTVKGSHYAPASSSRYLQSTCSCGTIAEIYTNDADIPLKVGLPVAAAAAAYLNARWSVYYDVGLIKSLVKLSLKSRFAERGDRLNLFYVLENHALSPATADQEFIVYDGRSYTYHETYTMALRYGAWFKKVHRVRRKDIVAMDFMNSATFLFFVLGLWSIGAVPALINYNLAGKPLTHSVRTSTAKLLIVDEEVRNSFPPEQLETFASSSFRDGKGPVNVVFYTPDIEAQIMAMEPVREDDKVRGGVVPRDMALLIYTSGTTGLPKPAIISWKKCWSGSLFTGDWMNIGHSDRFFTVRFSRVSCLLSLTFPSACLFTTPPLPSSGS